MGLRQRLPAPRYRGGVSLSTDFKFKGMLGVSVANSNQLHLNAASQLEGPTHGQLPAWLPAPSRPSPSRCRQQIPFPDKDAIRPTRHSRPDTRSQRELRAHTDRPFPESAPPSAHSGATAHGFLLLWQRAARGGIPKNGQKTGKRAARTAPPACECSGGGSAALLDANPRLRRFRHPWCHTALPQGCIRNPGGSRCSPTRDARAPCSALLQHTRPHIYLGCATMIPICRVGMHATS